MLKNYNLKSFICGFFVCILLTTTVFAAPVSKNIQVVYNNIKLYVDGTLITPTDADGNVIEPFAYNGTTYLPVRALSEALGKNVTWDGSTSSVYIGESPDGQFMSDILQPYNTDTLLYLANTTMTMGGKKYYKGFTFAPFSWNTGEVYFNLDSKYSEITGLVGWEDNYNCKCEIQVLGDDNILAEYTLAEGDLPLNLNINVKGVNKLTIKMTKNDSGSYEYIINFANLLIQ